MRTTNFKRRIAAVLSAGMVLTMLAPALPVRAATGSYEFDKGIWGKYTGGSLSFSITGRSGTSVKTALPAEPSDRTRLYMPYMDAAGTAQVGNSFNGVPFDFEGYKISGWYSNDQENMMQGFTLDRIPTHFDYRNIKYFPRFIGDTTKNYNFKVDYNVAGFGAINPPGANRNYNALDGFQATPIFLAGFRVKPGFPTFKFYKPGTNNEVTPPASAIGADGSKYGIKSENGYVSGTMTNKDLKVEYEYEVDQDQKFPIVVVHHKLDAQGQEKVPPDDFFVPAGSFYATETISDPDLRPLPQYVLPSGGGVAKFILANGDNPATPGIEKAPYFTKASGLALDSGAAAHALGLLDTQDTGLQVTPDGTVSGRMLNAGIQLHYYYVPNPAYFLNVSVKYVNELGQNITDQVVRKINELNPGTVLDAYDSAQNTKYYKSGNMIELRVIPTQQYQVYAPVLPRYRADNGAVIAHITDNGDAYQLDQGEFSGQGWTSSATAFSGKMGDLGESIEITVFYVHEPNVTQQLIIDTEGDGKLMKGAVEYDPTDGTHVIVKEKESDGSIWVDQHELPTMVQGRGYLIDGWYLGGTQVTTWPVQVNAPYRLKARFKKNPAAWPEITFAAGNNDPAIGLSVLGDPYRMNEYNADGVANLTLDMLRAEGLLPPVTIAAPNYAEVWQDENGTIIDPAATNILGYAGRTLYAYADFIGVPTINDPSAVGDLDFTGVPMIRINNRNPVSATKYVITDAAGRVVGVTSSAAIATAGGNIQGDFVQPGESYKVYEAFAGTVVAVGDDISTLAASDISAHPADVTIPVLKNASITEDPNNRGRASIFIEPVSPDTEYALVDSAGNEVYPFAMPTGSSVSFGDLEPDSIYHVVVRKRGSAAAPVDRLPGHIADTSNLGIALGLFKVEVVYPMSAEPTVKINGIDKTMADLDAVAPGAQLEITANGIDANGNFFKEWKDDLLRKPSGGRLRGNTYVFTMPSHPVKLQALYDTPASWSNAEYHNNAGDGKRVGMNYPDIQDPGEYKIRITKDPMPANIRAAIESDLGMGYDGLWLLHVEILKKNTSGIWELYTGALPDLLANIETGALISSKTYKLHAVDMANGAVSELNGDYNAAWKANDYSGEFELEVENDGYYAFGFTRPIIYTVEIRDSIDNRLIKNLRFASDEMENVGSKSSEYASAIRPDAIDADGISWTYGGLSLDRDQLVPYDENSVVRSNLKLYLFYASDKELRAETDRQLGRLLSRAEEILNGLVAPGHRARLQAAYEQAKAVREKMNPRKSSTPELQAALDELQRILNSMHGGGSGGSGGSGGGGGGGGGGSRNAGSISSDKPLHVGQDGDWILIDHNSHKWKFNLSSNTSAKGWARLSYTHNGERRVEWYHFDGEGFMSVGWFFDRDTGKWYYLSEDHNGFYGHMVTGWHRNPKDQRWYYLDPQSGEMLVGWQSIGGKWYYFAETSNEQTWFYNEHSRIWEFRGSSTRPFGSMYENERTPDGHIVDANGVWNP